MLALSDEAPKDVDRYLRKEGFTVPVAVGSRSRHEYGVTGIPASFLIGPDGKVVWKGHPKNLKRERVAEVVAQARRPGAGDFLALRADVGARQHASLDAAVEAAGAGRLAEALAAARAVATDEDEPDVGRAAASSLVRDVEAHVTLLQRQVERSLEAREPLATTRLLEGLARALDGTEAGEAAGERLAGLAKDEAWARELAGARALRAASAATASQGKGKRREAFEAVAEAHPDTRAAERAKRWARHHK